VKLRSVLDRLILVRCLARAARPRHQVSVLTVVAVIGVKQRLARNRPLTLHLAIGDFVVDELADLMAISEVLVGGEYAVDGLAPATIVDVGSHIGASVVFFRDRYPDAEIIAVEPDPLSFAKLRTNTARLSKVELRNHAVADRNGEAPFHVASHGWSSSLLEPPGARCSTTIQVRTLDDVVGPRSVGLLKLDIEGAEYEVLRAFRGLGRVQAIAVEYHARASSASLAAFLALLDGFEIVSLRGDSAHNLTIIAVRADAAPR